MKIDIGKVNLTEKDIEDWLFDNPEDFPVSVEYFDETPMVKWIGRQYHLPSGIADLVGLRENGMVAVIEVKNVAINKAAILQVCRYASDIEDIIGNRDLYNFKTRDGAPHIQKIVVGPSIDDQTFMEAEACNVAIICFSANVSIDLAEISWTSTAYDNHSKAINEISKQPEWDIFGSHYSDYVLPSLIPDDLSEERELTLIFGIPLEDCESKETDGDGNP